ncbi:hypothetical protein AB0C84_11950 [Actinomadura sp. NPDC048955]|uniref:hypothetical protein n=1 Tax=Actinomadura sp. NPDC048955 TaxID=3158228 RepID=UPI0033D13B89
MGIKRVAAELEDDEAVLRRIRRLFINRDNLRAAIMRYVKPVPRPSPRSSPRSSRPSPTH